MSKYINLVDKLTKEDKATITAYINKFGCIENEFIGIDKYLEQWSHSNQKLYKMLGEKLICEFPFSYSKTGSELEKEMSNLYYEENNFRKCFNRFVVKLADNKDSYNMYTDTIWLIKKLANINYLMNNKVEITLKYKKPDSKKMLQIQSGAKWFRAMSQLMNYFKDDHDWDLEAFEELRKQHAIIFSEKVIKGSLCLSIHPLDFMTMSDNSLNWSSCMSWTKDGCYHAGTVEMMNSNNVICAYLKDKKPYVFDKDRIDEQTGEIVGVWNNKRWRQLIYVTKDIIMTGKPYPYVATDLRNESLDKAKDLAAENLGWTYQYGPERYHDMVHIDRLSKMEKQRRWMRAKSYVKQNIIWDTKGMYNDMFNDSHTDYRCYRNEVDHTKIISVSGKCTCLACGGNVLEEDWDCYDYNDRYHNTGSVICHSCEREKFKCEYCDQVCPTEKFIISSVNGKICSHCFNKFLKVCPCCGRHAYIDRGVGKCFYNPYFYERLISEKEIEKAKEKMYYGDYRIYGFYDKEVRNYDAKKIDELLKDAETINLLGVYCCNDCLKELKNRFECGQHTHSFETERAWSGTIEWHIINPVEALPYIWPNLKKVTLEDYQTKRIVV